MLVHVPEGCGGQVFEEHFGRRAEVPWFPVRRSSAAEVAGEEVWERERREERWGSSGVDFQRRRLRGAEQRELRISQPLRRRSGAARRGPCSRRRREYRRDRWHPQDSGQLAVVIGPHGSWYRRPVVWENPTTVAANPDHKTPDLAALEFGRWPQIRTRRPHVHGREAEQLDAAGGTVVCAVRECLGSGGVLDANAVATV
mmetsp:Transcript_81579/g.227197  ORF Transcript_81579/g.227197 Transcript_81579/m.227197 type:complete len:200 (+) Transcript_81579:1584-2183(+)